MMKVVRLYGERDLLLTNEPLPLCLVDEEVVDGRAVDICGYDDKKFLMRRNNEHCKELYE